jgi:osmotically inducible lipoprotein OsmB
MKKFAISTVLLASALALAGCADTPRDNAAARGGLFGAAAGALVGAAATGRPGGALAGAAIGGATGAAVGAASADSERYSYRGRYAGRSRRCIRSDYDYDGNRICREYIYD